MSVKLFQYATVKNYFFLNNKDLILKSFQIKNTLLKNYNIHRSHAGESVSKIPRAAKRWNEKPGKFSGSSLLIDVF